MTYYKIQLIQYWLTYWFEQYFKCCSLQCVQGIYDRFEFSKHGPHAHTFYKGYVLKLNAAALYWNPAQPGYNDENFEISLRMESYFS